MTIPQQLLDPVPVLIVFIVFAIVALATYEIGFRVGRWWQKRTPDESEGPTGVLVGSILALLAFLLAITMGMASDRFDTRRGVVLAEANTINTTFLRAGYLPEPYGEEIRNLLREYVPLRIVSSNPTDLAADIARSGEILDELWVQAEKLVAETPNTDILALFIDSLNELIELHTTRVTAGLYARVPETVVLMLVIGAVLTMGVVGYSAGLTNRRSVLSAAILVIALGATILLVIDLDRPRDGFLQVSQQPLINLHERIGDPQP